MSVWRAASLGVLALALASCQPSRNVSFNLRFEEAATRSATAAIRVRILDGGCGGALLYSSVFDIGDPQAARTPPLLARGAYGFEAEARDASCAVIASTCLVRELPLDTDVLELVLEDVTPSPACAAGLCDDGVCRDDEPDAGPPPRDGGVDAGPMICTGDGECPGGRCRDQMCCAGCWDGTSCQGGVATAACGGGGEDCAACTGGQSCIGQACVMSPPVSLTLSPVTSYLRAGGSLWSAGKSDAAQRGELTSATANVFAQQDTTLAFIDVAASQLASCGIDTTGALHCWGRNAPGLLGINSSDFTREEVTPQRVGAAVWDAVEAGNSHFCAISEDGRLFCWGANAEGRLGVTTGSRSSPAEVEGGGTWRAVSPGDVHTCGIRSDGALLCWGSADGGRLGVAGATSGPTPQQVGTETDWVAVSAGVEHTCAIRGAGLLFCWGTQEFGRLGDGSTTGESATPVAIDTSNTWASVAAGQYHSCAVTSGRAIYCWGVGTRGQTGLGPSGDSSTPSMVTSGFDLVAAGWTHTCAASVVGGALGELRCWGEGTDGRLGTGRTDDENTPVLSTLEPAP